METKEEDNRIQLSLPTPSLFQLYRQFPTVVACISLLLYDYTFDCMDGNVLHSCEAGVALQHCCVKYEIVVGLSCHYSKYPSLGTLISEMMGKGVCSGGRQGPFP